MDGADRVASVARRLLGATALVLWTYVALSHGIAIVGGASMEPLLETGDVVVYRRGAEGVMVGDLIVYAHPEWGGGVIHRVVGIERDGRLVTRGDANDVDDREPVPRTKVRGIAVAVVPSGRLVTSAASVLH